MSTKYDDDIREAESRLVRDRELLLMQAADLTASARELASSPKGLLAAFVVGFILGELTAPRRSRQQAPKKSQFTQSADTTAKMGLGGLIGSALFAYARSRYGSPWEMGRSAWNYYRQQARRRAETQPRPSAPRPAAAPASSVVRPARAPAGSGTLSTAPAYSAPLRSSQRHAG
jgi:hypothetical protein